MPSDFRNVIKYCKNCGIQLQLKCSRDINRKMFCSRQCSSTYNYKLNNISRKPKLSPQHCLNCGIKISKQTKHKLCRTCFNTKVKPTTNIERECMNCGKLYRGKRSRINKKFCSASCLYAYRLKNSKKQKYICPECGVEFLRYASLVAVNFPCCSKRCWSKQLNKKRGKFHVFYVDGRTPLRTLIKNSSRYYEWRDEVFQKNGYKCKECGAIKPLHIHHLKPFSSILSEFMKKYSNVKSKEALLELAYNHQPFWEISNGKVLCYNCHANIHPNLRRTDYADSSKSV
jgi:5-methylcytosine-specific restriction endonuclease McrA